MDEAGISGAVIEGRDSSFTVHVPFNIKAYYLVNTEKPHHVDGGQIKFLFKNECDCRKGENHR